MRKVPAEIRRVVLVVLEGLRPSDMDMDRMTHLPRLVTAGAWTSRAERPGAGRDSAANFRQSIDKLVAELDIAGTRIMTADAEASLRNAQPTLSMQRRGLIVMSWRDAERSANDFGFASPAYQRAVRSIDTTIDLLASRIGVLRDPSTVLGLVSSHAWGSDDRPLSDLRDERELVAFIGASVVPTPLPKSVSITDVVPTIRWLLSRVDDVRGALGASFRSFRDDEQRPLNALNV